jgi:hypothetical protein
MPSVYHNGAGDGLKSGEVIQDNALALSVWQSWQRLHALVTASQVSLRLWKKSSHPLRRDDPNKPARVSGLSSYAFLGRSAISARLRRQRRTARVFDTDLRSPLGSHGMDIAVMAVMARFSGNGCSVWMIARRASAMLSRALGPLLRWLRGSWPCLQQMKAAHPCRGRHVSQPARGAAALATFR